MAVTMHEIASNGLERDRLDDQSAFAERPPNRPVRHGPAPEFNPMTSRARSLSGASKRALAPAITQSTSRHVTTL
jgi:hypothetical protein